MNVDCIYLGNNNKCQCQAGNPVCFCIDSENPKECCEEYDTRVENVQWWYQSASRYGIKPPPPQPEKRQTFLEKLCAYLRALYH